MVMVSWSRSNLGPLRVFFFQAEDGIRDLYVTGVQTCALPISTRWPAVVRRTAPDGLAASRTALASASKIGRASCRERVKILVVAVLIMIITSKCNAHLSSSKALDLGTTLLLVSSVRLKTRNCS